MIAYFRRGDHVATALSSTTKAATGTRLLFIDNIRWALIVLVICHHAAVTYSHVGGWYYLDGPEPPLATKYLLATFETFDQAFFMGFLFLLAGYFVPAAFDAKGAGRFLRDRAVRLGIPSAFFMLVIHPVIVYWLLRDFYDPSRPTLTQAYGRFISSGRVLSASGPMWFAVALLIFCVCYAGMRLVTAKPRQKDGDEKGWVPGHGAVIGVIAVMGTCSFLVRIFQPIGATILNMQLCYFSQYILMFALGIEAYRRNWLTRIEHSFGIFWLRLACFVGIPGWLLVLVVSGVLRGDTQNLLGGLHWQSAVFSFWEAFFCLGVCLGLTVVFRDRFNSQGRFSRWMSRNSFSAYLFHTPLLIAVTLSLRTMPAPVLVKWLVASAVAVPLVFVVSGLLRERIPGLRRLL